MSIKNLDMPEGNGIPDTYTDMMNHVHNGKRVGIIQVSLADGTNACFISAAAPVDPPPKTQKESLVSCLSMCLNAQNRAEARGVFPVVRAKLRA